MAVRLVIGGFDLSSYVRLPPGEEFDPADTDFLEPQFAESAVGAGDPLLSVKEGNKELIWPVHLTPTKSASWADTPDGLNLMVRDLNRALLNAKGVADAAEWREDGATSSTFHDVVFARFEPAYSAFKARKLWLSGVVRIWAPTYGDSGTLRLLASGIASGPVLTMTPTAFAVDGDAHAQILARIGSGSQVAIELQRHQQVLGLAVVPSGYQSWYGASRMIFEGPSAHMQPTLLAATNVIGTTALSYFIDIAGANGDRDWRDLINIPFSPASVYEGRNRVLLMANTNVGWGPIYRALVDRDPIGPEAQATANAPINGWQTLDLGVWEHIGRANQATAQIRIQVRRERPAYAWHNDDLFTNGLYRENIAGVLIIPDERMALVVDQNTRGFSFTDFYRRSVGFDASAYPLGTVAPGPFADEYGNLWYAENPFYYGAMNVIQQGVWVASLAAFNRGRAVLNATGKDIRSEVQYVNASAWLGASRFIGTGKRIANRANLIGQPEYVGARFAEQAKGTGYLSLVHATREGIGTDSSIMKASVAVPSMNFIAGELELHFNTTGQQIHAALWSNVTRGLIAAVTAAFENADFIGWPYIEAGGPGLASTTTDVSPRITKMRVSEIQASGMAPRSMYSFDGAQERVQRESVASIWFQDLGIRRRGAIPMLNPSRAEQIIAFSVPLYGGRLDDVLSMEVKVRERFGYAK